MSAEELACFVPPFQKSYISDGICDMLKAGGQGNVRFSHNVRAVQGHRLSRFDSAASRASS